MPNTLAMPGSSEGRQSSRMSRPKARSSNASAISPRLMRSPGKRPATSATMREIGASISPCLSRGVSRGSGPGGGVGWVSKGRGVS